MSKINGWDCPFLISPVGCTMFNAIKDKITSDTEYEQAIKRIENAEKFYPSIILDDGNTINFFFLQNYSCVAAENTAVYNDTSGKGQPIRQFLKGKSMGQARAYYDNGAWIGFERQGEPKQYNWVYIKNTTISAKALYAKGAKNDSELAIIKENNEVKQADANAPFSDKFLETIKTGFKYAAIAGGFYFIATSFFDSQKKSK